MDALEVDRLVGLVQGGHKESFRTLFVAFERPVRIYLSAHAHSTETVDAVLQASLSPAMKKIQTYERREKKPIQQMYARS